MTPNPYTGRGALRIWGAVLAWLWNRLARLCKKLKPWREDDK